MSIVQEMMIQCANYLALTRGALAPHRDAKALQEKARLKAEEKAKQQAAAGGAKK